MLHKFIITEKESDMGKSNITNNIRILRFHAAEMTQQELADEVGVSRQTIAAIEKEKYSPSLELAFRIARVFDRSLEEVFFYHNRSQTE